MLRSLRVTTTNFLPTARFLRLPAWSVTKESLARSCFKLSLCVRNLTIPARICRNRYGYICIPYVYTCTRYQALGLASRKNLNGPLTDTVGSNRVPTRVQTYGDKPPTTRVAPTAPAPPYGVCLRSFCLI